ncbi:MAG TPA: hypothetical protein VF510_20260 [Ktedonobacterales bacterium]
MQQPNQKQHDAHEREEEEQRALEEAERDRLALLEAWKEYYKTHPEAATVSSEEILDRERGER